ncbi:MAG: DUF444 family protein [Candidatus Vogelbacteria bacterium]|nr:DUF444 family protein [Candidatus Vogelbacteria bacterium]
MGRRIKQDEQEYMDIVKGKLKTREDLLGFIKRGELIVPDKKGGGFIIPMPEIYIPKLRIVPPPQNSEDGEGDGPAGTGPTIGVGQDPGVKPGDVLGPVNGGEDGEGEGDRQAGRGRGQGSIPIELSEEESIELLMELLQLPRIQPKGAKHIKTEENKYTQVRKTGPDSLLHKRRTLKEALKRSIIEGTYVPADPKLVPIRQDRRFRASEVITKPQNNAVIFYMMDVSGSMSKEDRKIVKFACQLISFWLRANYDGVEEVWIVHDDGADRVKREQFFAPDSRFGGTTISSAHELMVKIYEDEFPPSQWNIYPFYFSDGFNWSGDDALCLKLLLEKILPAVNQYSHAEISAHRPWMRSPTRGGSTNFSPAGSFGQMLVENFTGDERVACAKLQEMNEVPDAIKTFFGKGK